MLDQSRSCFRGEPTTGRVGHEPVAEFRGIVLEAQVMEADAAQQLVRIPDTPLDGSPDFELPALDPEVISRVVEGPVMRNPLLERDPGLLDRNRECVDVADVQDAKSRAFDVEGNGEATDVRRFGHGDPIPLAMAGHAPHASEASAITSVPTAEELASMFEVGDTVVYPPHGPGVVVESPASDGPAMLTIRIARSNLTLSVPAAIAGERGVRPTITEAELAELLAGMSAAGEALHDTAQLRTRAAAEVERSGDAHRLAATIRDYEARQQGEGKLTAPERKVLETARRTLASEIAFVRDIEVEAAEALLDESLA